MKIGIVLPHPTQFDTPFFRYAHLASTGALRVIYTRDPHARDLFFDPEVGTVVSWGIPLLEGYDWTIMPRRRRWSWLRGEFRLHGYDLVIISGYRDPGCLLAAAIARFSGVPVALRLDTAHFAPFSSQRWLAKAMLFRLLKQVLQNFFAVGTSTKQFLESVGVPRLQIGLFPYAVDVEWFRRGSTLTDKQATTARADYGLPDDHSIVLSICKFSEREAPWDLLRAFCSTDLSKTCLWLVGEGDQRSQLEAYAGDHPGRRVIFGGYLPYPRLPTAYGLADVFVHPAKLEPWGVSVHEALACGLPVIASSTVGSVYDLISEGKNGFVYPSGDWPVLRQRLRDAQALVRNPQAREETGRLLRKVSYPVIWNEIISAARTDARSGTARPLKRTRWPWLAERKAEITRRDCSPEPGQHRSDERTLWK